MSPAVHRDWVCPRCHRSFVQRHARHSCDRQTVRHFFSGRPELFELFEQIRRQIERFGPCELAATRSQLSFKARIRFAWVWLPQQYLRQAPQDALVLTAADRLDREAIGWLREAQALAS